MKRYRLIALDLDGTTLTDEKTLSPATKEWIGKAMDAGIHVIFSTGRGVQTAGGFREELGLQTPMVFLNGADLWRTPTEHYKRHLFLRDDIVRLHKLAMEADAHYWGYSIESLSSRKNWTDAHFDENWMKFGMSHPDPVVLKQLRETVKEWGFEVTHSHVTNMEISLLGVTKESGVREVCDMLDISMDEVIAMGDSRNDYFLLKAAGLGVAMGNAEDEIKEMADAQTATNQEDGVALAIQKYIFGIDAPTKVML
ncbi:5-amino-6-(5-phospho-D-ribitylamino)uracil phosphatase YcsE [Paenibacillus sp. J31TS4]|uniref:Cof-type HAD-IIB family hydrolase n=1 Tax=Paenibacillus sp. J31TS4 TaxID=2807195 RepID=UPI001B1A154D|nr:Cof-type HAD-IIB family hydrolase [Paenibacillus sp. J31TS4]GIP40900.1 5-amino-6-(5-phospho-D-ribitylamino)uracil phosphatase YcsE [Paenibacillus sp. J31TS4]